MSSIQLPDESRFQLPKSAPEIIPGDSVNSIFLLPWAVYCIDRSASESNLQHLATELEQRFATKLEREFDIEVPRGDLVQLAPTSSLYQPSLQSTLDTHIQYGHENKAQLEYYPYGFLVAHDKDWQAKGLWLVYVDFEGDNPLTAFRLTVADAGDVCSTLRNDNDSASQIQRDYKIED